MPAGGRRNRAETIAADFEQGQYVSRVVHRAAAVIEEVSVKP
jgi:hypothetical protein